MTTVADLGGWWMARCKISKDEMELTILEPASDGDQANSITITDLDAILALRDCISEEIARFNERLELEQDIVKE